jgi:hypothetical protein
LSTVFTNEVVDKYFLMNETIEGDILATGWYARAIYRLDNREITLICNLKHIMMGRSVGNSQRLKPSIRRKGQR